MPIFDSIPNSATTLSVNYRPGQEKRLLASNTEAIFSFGDFTIEQSFSSDSIANNPRNLSFGTFDNLNSLNATGFTTNNIKSFVKQNELNLPKKDPKSYCYFSSFYTSVASAINKIIEEYPYAILSYNNGADNIFDYVEYYDALNLQRTSSFKIPISGLTNQGNIFITSGNSSSSYGLVDDYDKFCIQISGDNKTFKIKEYSLSATYLQFTVYDFLKESGVTTTYSDAVYIRPTIERLYNYNNEISTLETQLLKEGIFNIPQSETIEDDYVAQEFVWPKTIDGWAPDSYGTDFETYKNSILSAAEKIDEEKTDIFIKTVIPENYLELDSDGEIYHTIIQSYAYEFDQLKNYINAIAYAHSVEYNNEETVPKKFMGKLGNLLGWKLSEGFNELSLFDYLTSDLDQNSNSYSYFNVEIWRRILINIVWLYKKKGTRDAISFIFRLLGAPDCLINFNEFVYDIIQTTPNITEKVDVDGFINYNSSLYKFQEGGQGRGNGQAYINQWLPEFNPLKREDNDKVELGTSTGGTRNILNTKEVGLSFSPAQAIEDDVFEYYQEDCSVWTWGSSCPPYSCMTIPYEYLSFTSDDVRPANISAMTLSQYVDYVYTNSIEPRNRKTNAQCHTTWSYPELKNIYLAYYYATCTNTNHLSMCKLEAYLQLLEVQLGDYILQLVPATTIFQDGAPTVYKNTVFHRQRFVYKEGVDKGSMFQKPLIDPPSANIISCFPNNVKICVFAGESRLPSGQLDITGNSWRLEKNIPNQNICPSAKNLKVQYIHCSKPENRRVCISAFKLSCNVNSNSISTSLGAITLTPTSISEMSQNLISEEILNH